MIKGRLSGQQTILHEPDELKGIAEHIMERLRQKGRLKASVASPEDIITTNLNALEVEGARIAGPLIVAQEFWRRLPIEEILTELGFKKRDIMLTMVEVSGRLIAPVSEDATVAWLKRTALADINNNNKTLMELKRDSLYRITDMI